MICCLVRDDSSAAGPDVLEAVARMCSPRVMVRRETAVVFDAGGLDRALGPPADIAREITRVAAEQQVVVRVALADTMAAAWLLAHAHSGITIVESGRAAAALAPLPLSILKTLPGTDVPRTPSATPARRRRRRSSRHYRRAPGPHGTSVFDRPVTSEAGDHDALLETCARWGLDTLGDLARLPRAEVRTRLGLPGVRVHQAARGEDEAPLVPTSDALEFRERLDLDWPIEGLEPLAFVLARVCEGLSVSLEQADRGAVVITTRLHLVTRETCRRTLRLPAPMRDARVLRTLILLDLESHPPTAGIDAVDVTLDVTPGRIVQGSLLARALPAPEDLSTLLARLGALVGESRVGAPALVDTHDTRAVGLTAFSVNQEPLDLKTPAAGVQGVACQPREGVMGFRRFRRPIAAGVALDRGAPVRVTPAARRLTGGPVVACAGPWRMSGQWWSLDRTGWDRDEWDVELAGGGCYRLARDRGTGRWVIEGELD
jgi:protein ImuB